MELLETVMLGGKSIFRALCALCLCLGLALGDGNSFASVPWRKAPMPGAMAHHQSPAQPTVVVLDGSFWT